MAEKSTRRGQSAPQNSPGGPTSSRKDFRTHVKATRAGFDSQVKATRAQFDQANEKITARSGRNLFLAVLIGLALGGVILVSIIVIKELFIIFAGILLAFSAFELAGALRKAGRAVPRVGVVVVAVLICPMSYFFGAAGQWTALFAGAGVVTVWTVVASLPPAKRSLATRCRDVLASLLVVVYVAFLGSFAVLLAAQDGGQWWTLAFLILVIATDVGAYTSGILFGRRPLAPSISPNKTWEGFLGGLLFGVIAGVLLALFMLGEPWWFGIIFGIIIFGTATLGDLAESLMKRDLGVKDMGSWLPGHGGFLDRIDSVLPSGAVAYILFLLFA